MPDGAPDPAPAGRATGAVQAVIFDVDGTLYRQRPLRRAMARALAGAYWWRPWAGWRTARILSAYRHAHEAIRAERSASAAGDLHRAQVDRAAAAVGAAPDVVAATAAEWMESAPLAKLGAHAQPGLTDALARLRAAGIRLGVVSDYPAAAKLAALGVAAEFDVVVAAQDADVGALKPDPRGIEHALRELGVAACHAVYVGDRDDVDAPAAAAAGVRCVLIGARADGAGSAAGPAGDAVAHVVDMDELVELVSGWM